MNADTIREWLRREPFQAFELHLSNGRRYEVRHPEMLAVGRNAVSVYKPDVDTFAHVALIHVNSIEVLQPA